MRERSGGGEGNCCSAKIAKILQASPDTNNEQSLISILAEEVQKMHSMVENYYFAVHIFCIAIRCHIVLQSVACVKVGIMDLLLNKLSFSNVNPI